MMKRFGNQEVNSKPELYGYEFGKPCKFPFRLDTTLFYGCIWSSYHETIGPWCFTETTTQLGYTHSPKQNKWGICSDTCPEEDCPACEDNFSYKGQNYSGCTNEVWPEHNAFHFVKSQVCSIDNESNLWKFCSSKCKHQNKPISKMCNKSTHNHYHDIQERDHAVIYRYYENVTSKYTSKNQTIDYHWCPVRLDKSERAVCSSTCDQNDF